MEQKPKKQRGGYRKGGGRPKGTTKKSKTFRIDLDLAEYLETKVGNQDALVNMLIRNYKQQSESIIETINKQGV